MQLYCRRMIYNQVILLQHNIQREAFYMQLRALSTAFGRNRKLCIRMTQGEQLVIWKDNTGQSQRLTETDNDRPLLSLPVSTRHGQNMMNPLWLNPSLSPLSPRLSSLPMPSAGQVTCAPRRCRMNLDLRYSLWSTFNTWRYRYICITHKCIHIRVHECLCMWQIFYSKVFQKALQK